MPSTVVYRNEQTALHLEHRTLRAENARLRAEVETLKTSCRELGETRDRAHRAVATGGCLSCGGPILRVAIFAGHRAASPVPLQVSTARFCDDRGGFRGAAMVQARACGSCGLVHAFVARPDPGEDPPASLARER